MVILITGLCVLHEPIGQVVVVGGGMTGGRIGHRCQITAVIVGIGDGIRTNRNLVFHIRIGLRGYPALTVILILYPVTVTVVKSFQITVLILCVGIACQYTVIFHGYAGRHAKSTVGKRINAAGCRDFAQSVVAVAIRHRRVFVCLHMGNDIRGAQHRIV